MVNNLHKISDNLVFKIILKIVIVLFILSNISSYLININENYALKINGQKISFNQFEKAFNNKYNYLYQQLDDQNLKYALNEKDKKNVKKLRRQALYFFIDEILLNQYARKIGLFISDEKIKKTIFSIPEFQYNGHFDNDHYLSVIKKMGISADQYAQELHDQLIIQQLINAVFGTEFVLKGEIENTKPLIYQKRIVREMIIDIKALSKIQKVNDIEVNDYYEENKNIFIIPEQFRMVYIKLDPLLIKENVSDAEMQDYYNHHKEQFIKPQRNHYSIIQTKTKYDAEKVLHELENGVDFAKVAKEKSTDSISSKNGGNIGWLTDATIPVELRNANLKKKGQISKIIKSYNGYLIVRLNNIESSIIQPFTMVRHEIFEKIQWKKALNNYTRLQEKISVIVNKNRESLDKIEQISGMKKIETNWFDRNHLPRELNCKQVTNVLLKENFLNKRSKLKNKSIFITDNNRSFLLHITAYKPKFIKPLKEVKNEIIAAIKYNKATKQARKNISRILSELKLGKDSKIMKKNGLKFSPPKILVYTTKDPITQKAFSLEKPMKDKLIYGITNDVKGNIVLIVLDKIKTIQMPEFQKKAIMKDIIQNNVQTTFLSLIENLRKEAKVTINNVFK